MQKTCFGAMIGGLSRIKLLFTYSISFAMLLCVDAVILDAILLFQMPITTFFTQNNEIHGQTFSKIVNNVRSMCYGYLCGTIYCRHLPPTYTHSDTHARTQTHALTHVPGEVQTVFHFNTATLFPSHFFFVCLFRTFYFSFFFHVHFFLVESH